MTTVPSNQLKAMQYEIADLKEQLAECQRERDVLLIAHKAHETANLKLLAKMKQQAFELAALKAEQVEPVEPVAYLDANYGFMRCGNAADHLPIGTKLYAVPPQPAKEKWHVSGVDIQEAINLIESQAAEIGVLKIAHEAHQTNNLKMLAVLKKQNAEIASLRNDKCTRRRTRGQPM